MELQWEELCPLHERKTRPPSGCIFRFSPIPRDGVEYLPGTEYEATALIDDLHANDCATFFDFLYISDDIDVAVIHPTSIKIIQSSSFSPTVLSTSSNKKGYKSIFCIGRIKIPPEVCESFLTFLESGTHWTFLINAENCSSICLSSGIGVYASADNSLL